MHGREPRQAATHLGILEQTFTFRAVRSQQEVTGRPPLSAIVSDPKDGAGIASAYLECGYNQQEIADHLGVHYSTVSRRMHAIGSCRRRNTMRDCRTPTPQRALRCLSS
jgi:hypothetical protein